MREVAPNGGTLRRFRPYPAYKDSGVEWLGKIPAHWEVKRLWHLTPSARRIMYGIVLPGPNVDDGVPIVKGGDVSPDRLRLDRLNRTTREIESGYVRSRLRGGDLVYAIRGSIGEVAIVPDEIAGANLTQDAARIAYTPETHGRWLLHTLKSTAVFAQLEAGAVGATIRGINIRDLKRASIAVPPDDDQRAIAAFLDRETERIDALVAKKERLIELLQEKRTALTAAAIEGPPSSPATRLAYQVDLQPGYAFPSDHFSHNTDDIRLLRGVNISPGIIRWDETVYWPMSESERYVRYRLRPGDLVFGMDRPWITAGIRVAGVTVDDVPSLLLQRVARLRAKPDLSQPCLKLILASP